MINRALTLPAIVTLVLLTVLAALVAGASAVSAQGAVPDAPDRPVGTAVFVGGVDLEWNDVPGADSYDVQMYRNGQWTDLPGDGIETAFYGAGAIISELDPDGSSYWFRVRGGSAHGFSEWSDFNFMASTNESRLGRRARPDNVPASGEPAISVVRRRSGRASRRIRRALGTETVWTGCSSGFNGSPTMGAQTLTSRTRRAPPTPWWPPTRARPSGSGLPSPIGAGTRSR